MGSNTSNNGNGRWIWPAVLSALLVVAIFVFGFSLAQAGRAEVKADSAASALAEYRTEGNTLDATQTAEIAELKRRLARMEEMLERLSDRLNVPVPPRVEYEQ